MNIFSQQYRVTCHTDHVGPGTTFVAIKGFQQDGVSYIPLALEKGADHIVIEQGTKLSQSVKDAITQLKAKLTIVASARKALAELSAQAYGNPANSLKIIGITGTKGKTTTSYLLEHILKAAGKKTALVGTVTNRILDVEYKASLTTPQPDYLHRFLYECKKRGVEYVILEAAAQAFSLHRLDEISFDAALFTNFSIEHSEFYDSQDEYFAAKCSLFNQLSPDGLAVLNADDKKVSQVALNHMKRVLISMRGRGTYNGKLSQSTLTLLKLTLSQGSEKYQLSSKNLLGEFSAYNILFCVAVARRYGIDLVKMQRALDSFAGVPGRLACTMLPNKALAIIDNAHTPSSFEAFFKAVRPLSNNIVAVFGAGGDRDVLKRPLMGAVAAKFADTIIVTADNPRSEKVADITKDILGGIDERAMAKVTIEHDREKAIRKGYEQTQEGSLLVLLGKGPVEYQQVQEKKLPFSESSIIRSLRS